MTKLPKKHAAQQGNKTSKTRKTILSDIKRTPSSTSTSTSNKYPVHKKTKRKAQKDTTKRVTFRIFINSDLLAQIKAFGKGWQAQVEAILRKAARNGAFEIDGKSNTGGVTNQPKQH